MRSSTVVFAVVGLAGVSAQPVHAQAPAAVVADPPVDSKFPPGGGHWNHGPKSRRGHGCDAVPGQRGWAARDGAAAARLAWL